MTVFSRKPQVLTTTTQHSKKIRQKGTVAISAQLSCCSRPGPSKNDTQILLQEVHCSDPQVVWFLMPSPNRDWLEKSTASPLGFVIRHLREQSELWLWNHSFNYIVLSHLTQQTLPPSPNKQTSGSGSKPLQKHRLPQGRCDFTFRFPSICEKLHEYHHFKQHYSSMSDSYINEIHG